MIRVINAIFTRTTITNSVVNSFLIEFLDKEEAKNELELSVLVSYI